MSDPKKITKVFEDDAGVTAYFNLFEVDGSVQLIKVFIKLDQVRTGGISEQYVEEAITDFVTKLSIDT